MNSQKTGFSTIIVKYLLFLLFFFYCCTREANQTSNITLEYVQSIGAASENFISRSRAFVADAENVYVADLGQSAILQYNKKGKFIKSFGKEGRGPGEFSGTIVTLDMLDSLIFVPDLTNLRLSVFNIDGHLVKTIKMSGRHFGEFVVTNEYLIFGPNVTSFQRNLEGEDRFYLYDHDGNKLHSFGQFLDLGDGIPAMMSRAYLDVKNDTLHVAYNFFPIYQVYDLEGNLLAEHNLETITDIEGNEANKDASTFENVPHKGELENVTGVYADLDVSGNYSYLLRASLENLHIEKFRRSRSGLTFVEEFKFPLAKRDIIGYLDFAYNPDNKSFFVMEVTDKEGFVLSEYGIIDSES